LTDLTRFYIASDYELMIDIFKSELNFLKSSWQNMLGRPLVVMAMKSIHLGTWCDGVWLHSLLVFMSFVLVCLSCWKWPSWKQCS